MKPSERIPLFHLQLLGIPVLSWQGEDFALSRRQARALLFRLAIGPPTTRDDLCLLLWPDAADATARRNLTRLLSYIRQTLPHPDLLSVNRTAVSRNPDLVSIDVTQFQQLCVQDDAAALATAVSLVRAPFLAGFSLPGSREYDFWLTQTQQHIERQYLAALSRLVELKTVVPDHPAAIQYIQQYLAADDLAEDMHRQLITLYAANGDRSAALRQYEQCFVVLERELGVAPLPQTRAAYEAARDGRQLSVPAKAPEPKWATLPSLDLPLIGREAASTALTAAYQRFRNGGVIFISGAPGVGKSRLMQEFATAQPALPLTGNSYAGGQTAPYQPLIQALRQALSQPARWQRIPPIWLAEVSRLLPELRTHFPDLPQPVDVEPREAQTRLFEALTQVITGLAQTTSAAAGSGPALLLCLDDAHWADEATLGWLHFAANRLAGSGICIVATYRTYESAPLQEWQGMLHRTNLSTTVSLGGLTVADVAAILRQVDDAADSYAVLGVRIHRATGGNTFFVLETVRELLETGQLSDHLTALPLPHTVREAVLRRAGRLSPLARQVLEITAVLSPHTAVSLIIHTCGRGELAAAEGLEELTACQMLRVEGDQFHFQHALAQEAVYQQISPWRRRLLHRRAAQALATLPSQKDGELAAIIATHFETANEMEQAVDYFRQAAVMAQNVYANHESAYYYEKTLTLMKDGAFDEKASLQVRLYEGLGQVLRRQALYERAEQAFQAMYGTAAKLNDPKMMAQAWLRLGEIQDSLKKYPEALESAVKAKTISTNHQLDITYAYALYAQAWALFRLDKLDEALPIALKAVEKSKQLNHHGVLARSQNTLGAIYKYRGQYQLSEHHQQMALELFRELGDTRRVTGMLNNLGETARLRQDFLKAYDFYQQAVMNARQIGEKDWLVEFLGNLGLAQIKLEKYPDAERSLCQAIEAAQAANFQIDATLYLNLTEAYLAQGQWADAEDTGKTALRLAQESRRHTVVGEAWRILGKIAERMAVPILIGATSYDAAACRAQSRHVFAASDEI